MTSAHRIEITKDNLVTDLRKIGVAEGDHLAVVLSLKSVGFVVGGPRAFIEALLEVVGPNGTIMMNTHTRSFALSEVARDYLYNYRSTPCWTGAVPETLRKWENAVRSKNPKSSIVAVGKFAEYLTEGHDEHASLYAPYSRLGEVGGKYLCVGLKDNLVAIRHEAQRLAGLNDVVKMFVGVKYVDDCGTVKVYIVNCPPCTSNLPSLVPKLEASGVLRTGKIGTAKAYLAPTKELLDSMKKMLMANPRLTLCNNPWCNWCREAERKLNPSRTTCDGKRFQRGLFAVTVLRLINTFRLRRYLFLSFQRGQGHDRITNRSYRRILNEFLNCCYLTVVDLLR